ncbi:MAG: hypothetical protein E5Y61_21015 [Mesorhizobium sp.]|nr:MAG: hypothetical protein E5Y61_21015 [Mesorhizobium sp.]TIM80873.1 MAG: hypothetical protein E5Y60_01720 [Mesorhizobium sp.]
MIDNPMNRAPRCQARSKRSGVGCKAPAVRGHRVCRFNGAGGGAPRGAAHGLYRHGRFTCEAIEQRREISALIADARRAAAAVI